MLRVFLLVLLLVLVQSAEAETWPDAITQGNQQLDRGLYQDAIAQYQTALIVSDSPARRGDTLYRLAVAHGKLAEYSAAEHCYKEALGIFRAEGDSSRLALSLAGLGEIYRDEYRPDQALILEKQNLIALQQIGRGKGAEAAAILNITGAILFAEQRYKEAERDMKEASDIFSNVSGPESLDVALVLNNLGAIALARGRIPEAETLVTRGVAIRKARLGLDHPLVAGAMLSLASVYMAERRYSEADRACQDSIGIMNRFLPPAHPDLIKAGMQLAAIAHDAGHPAAALDILEQAVARIEEDHAAIKVEYVQLLNLYSRYLETAGQKEKSRRIHHEALARLRELNRPSETNSTVAIGELAVGHSPNP